MVARSYSLPSRVSDSSNLPYRELASFIIRTAVENKALDTTALDVTDLTDVTDCFIICTGTSDIHLKGIADKIKLVLKSLGELPLGISGYAHGDWILLDYGNVVVHILSEEARSYYDLEGLWDKASILPFPPDIADEARRLRTGLFLPATAN